jgi:peptidoglycan/xylan/chitin deacetylase (PgdA/CDA1 family)
MKRQVLIICSLLLFIIQCSPPHVDETAADAPGVQLPRVLIITTGISNDNSQLAQGIVVAIQSFNKMGATVRLEPRDILYDYQELKKYSILIISTFPGYHDADRKYSLSYMSDEELHNLALFVENGGVLISGENVGRNYTDGTDRVILFSPLNPDNWELSKCYGVTLSEKNLTGFNLEGNIPGYFQWDIPRTLLSGEDRELWTLTPDSFISENSKILGYWKKGHDSLIAVVESRYGKGKSILLASSGFLHPSNDGGFWSEVQIDQFYKYVIDSYNKENGIAVSLNPWPLAHDYAFCVSLNAEGEMDQYKRVLNMLSEKNINPTVFVNGSVGGEIKSMLIKGGYTLASSGFGYINHSDLKYPQAVEDILLNEHFWDRDFTGFRFPFTIPGYWSLLALDEHDYTFESSIGADNLDFFHGSIVPYNLVITDEGFYRSTDILEIGPTYHDDYYFLDIIKEGRTADSSQLDKNIRVYGKYLGNFWNYAVKPYKGLMVYLGHPKYVGYNDSTLTTLENLISEVQKDNTWITTLNDVAGFRKDLGTLQFFVAEQNMGPQIVIKAPENVVLKDVCLNFTGKVKKASAKKGTIKIINNSQGSQLVFDAFNGQSLSVQFD